MSDGIEKYSDESQFVLPAPAPASEDFSKSISVYSYATNGKYDLSALQALSSRSSLVDNTFGIIYEWPQMQNSFRSLWAKLGEQVRTFVDRYGEIQYRRLRRLITASAVCEFFDRDGELNLLVFGGGSSIHTEIVHTVTSRLNIQAEQQALSHEALRRIFHRHEKKLRMVQVDPSQDTNWGQAKEALLKSKGKYIDASAPVMRTISQNTGILIYGFKSDQSNVSVDGMKRPIKVTFEVTNTSVRISANGFEVHAGFLVNEKQIFYDLARQVYFAVIGKEEWSLANAHALSMPVQTMLFGEQPELELT